MMVIILIGTSEEFDFDNFVINASPNPATDVVLIELEYPSGIRPEHLHAAIYDTNGKLIVQLPAAEEKASSSIWKWTPTAQVPAGIYHCKVFNEHGSISTRIVLVR